MKFCFGDVVVVDEINIGVIVKSRTGNNGLNYNVYVRTYNKIINYPEDKIQRYMVRHKYLNEEEIEYQHNAVNGI